MKNRKGQFLVGVLVLLAVLAIIVPVMVKYIQNEALWSEKQAENTNAFQLAEAAVDRGYQKVCESTTTWNNIKKGLPIAGFNFDTVYTDMSGGTYTISITSGPLTQQVTILAVGQDRYKKEPRALKVIYGNSVMDDVSIAAAEGVAMNGSNIQVEWGAVTSPNAVSILTKTHPSFWSAAGIDKDTNGAAPPNCDAPNCWWWHSYDSNLPPMPQIDFSAYKSSAIAEGTDPCGNAYYQPGNFSNNCDSLNGNTYYIEGSWTGFRSAIVGNIIVLGNFTFSNGSQHTVGFYNAAVPPTAWKQYCNDWGYYQDNYDPSVPDSPVCFGNINNSTQRTGLTKSINPAIHGFMYVGGDMTLPNGGGSDDLVHGAVIVNGNANINSNSHCKVYYDPSVAADILTTKIYLTRVSWLDSTQKWPSTLP